MLKPKITKIVNEFFVIGGNHDSDQFQLIRNQLLDVLREEEFLLSEHVDENVILAKDVIRYIDASSLYAEETNLRKAYTQIKPFFSRLVNSSWNYYDIQLLAGSIEYTETATQAIELATKAQEYINIFKRVRSTDALEALLAVNLCSRILIAKYFDDQVETSLVIEFQKGLKKLENLVKHNQELAMLLLITKIRQALLSEHDSRAQTLCEELEFQYDKQIGATIRNEVEFYQQQRKIKRKTGLHESSRVQKVL